MAGVVKKYNIKGQLIEEYFQNNGKKEGEHKEYLYGDDSLYQTTTVNFINDKKHGCECTYFDTFYDGFVLDCYSYYDNGDCIYSISRECSSQYMFGFGEDDDPLRFGFSAIYFYPHNARINSTDKNNYIDVLIEGLKKFKT